MVNLENHPSPSTEPARESPVKLAVVEDNATLRRNIERWFNRAPGFRCVATCGDASEALKLLPIRKPDVVLMDIELPGMSGVECAAQLKRQLPTVQIMMLTVYEDTETIFKALRAGASGYLLKRSSLPAVQEAILEMHRGGAPMTSEIARKVVAAFQESTGAESPASDLTAREREILGLLTQCFTNKEIGAQLNISPWTVKIHLSHIFEKLHVRSRAEAVNVYRGHGLGASSPTNT